MGRLLSLKGKNMETKSKYKASSTAYKNEYIKANYDRIGLVVPKGKREVWQALAKGEGKSLSGYIIEAVEAYAFYTGKTSASED